VAVTLPSGWQSHGSVDAPRTVTGMGIEDWIVILIIGVAGIGTGFWLIRRITGDANEPRSFRRYRRK
jgi:hypothetical protein